MNRIKIKGKFFDIVSGKFLEFLFFVFSFYDEIFYKLL